MSNLHFTDPHIQGRATFSVGDDTITVPALQPEELCAIAANVRERAREYFEGDNDPLHSIATVLSRWTDPSDPRRQEALPVLSRLTGFSVESIARFGFWPLGRLRLNRAEADDLRQRLMFLTTSGNWRRFSPWTTGRIRAFGTPKLRREQPPTLLLHSLAGNVVGTMWMSLIFGFGERTGQLLKLSSDDPASFYFLLDSIEEIDPALRRTIACGYYAGGGPVQSRVLQEADMVFALGTDATMAAIKAGIDQVSPGTRLLAHGQKIGFQIVSREYATEEAAELVAWGASACDGNACFSPANVYVERGGTLEPERFAEVVGDHMASIAKAVPPKRTLAAAERVTAYRQRQLQRTLLGDRVRMLRGAGTEWTVVVDEENPALTPTCQERTIVVKPVSAIDQVPQYVRHLGRNLQTVGLAVGSDRLLSMADELAEVGATNLKMLGTEYIVGLDEPHDGIFDMLQLTMSDGLRWTHLAFSDTDCAMADALAENRTATATALGHIAPGVTPA